MRVNVYWLIVLLAPIGLAAQCGTEPEEVLNETTLVGTWEGSGSAYDGFVDNDMCRLFERNVQFVFRGDGTHTLTGETYNTDANDCGCAAGETFTLTYSLSGTWTLNGAVLELNSSGESEQCNDSMTIQVPEIQYRATAELVNGALSFSVDDTRAPDYRLRRADSGS